MPLILDINGWIVTLDVLKSIININVLPLRFSWIVTLDVLKFQKNMANMQHIHSWIVTLDVLKWQRYSCKDNCYLVE